MLVESSLWACKIFAKEWSKMTREDIPTRVREVLGKHLGDDIQGGSVVGDRINSTRDIELALLARVPLPGFDCFDTSTMDGIIASMEEEWDRLTPEQRQSLASL